MMKLLCFGIGYVFGIASLLVLIVGLDDLKKHKKGKRDGPE